MNTFNQAGIGRTGKQVSKGGNRPSKAEQRAMDERRRIWLAFERQEQLRLNPISKNFVDRTSQHASMLHKAIVGSGADLIDHANAAKAEPVETRVAAMADIAEALLEA